MTEDTNALALRTSFEKNKPKYFFIYFSLEQQIFSTFQTHSSTIKKVAQGTVYGPTEPIEKKSHIMSLQIMWYASAR